MLDRLRMRTDDALETYNTLAQAIFSMGNKKWKGQDGTFGQYSGEGSEEVGVQTRARGAYARYFDLVLDFFNSAEISPKKSDTSMRKSKATESVHDSQHL